MKDFKKLIKEAYLGNPLNEIDDSKRVSTKHLDAIIYEDGGIKLMINSSNKSPYGYTSRDLIKAPFGVSDEEFTFDYVKKEIDEVYKDFPDKEINELLLKVTQHKNSLNEEDRATRVDMYLSGEEEYPEFDPQDVIDDLENEDKLPDGFHSKEDLDQFLKDNPFDSERYKKLSIAQKQDILSYLNRDTEKEFERRMAMREEFSSTEQKMINTIKSYKKRGSLMVNLPSKVRDFYFKNKEKIDALNEALDPKDFPANFFYGGKIYVFDRIAGGDRAVYYNPKYNGDKLVFGSRKQMEDYLDDYVEPKGGTQSSHFGTNEDINEDKYFSLEKGDKLKVPHPIYKNLTLTITNPKGSGYEYYSKHDEGGVEKGWAEAGYFSSAIEKGDAELIKAVKEDINESVTPSTRVTYIASPAPRKMLAQELEDLFGDDYRNIVTEFQDDGGYESVLMFNLTDSDIERIEDEIGDVLIGEYSLKKVKDIQETLKEDMNDPVLVKTRAAQMKKDAIDKKDLENKSKRISADEAIDLRYELSILNKEREDILMRIEDIAVEMDQTAEPEGGPIADELGERLMAAQRELRAIDSKIIDIKDDLGIFDMNESDLDEGTCGYGEDGIIGDKPAGPDLNEDDELNVNIDNANDNYAKAIDAESRSGAYESLQESLRKKLQDRLK